MKSKDQDGNRQDFYNDEMNMKGCEAIVKTSKESLQPGSGSVLDDVIKEENAMPNDKLLGNCQIVDERKQKSSSKEQMTG